MAAFREHHTVVDAIWGYTQFKLDAPTTKYLTVCHRSGLYEWLRMPFGPAPAPAEMQSYVHQRFGTLRCARTQEKICAPLIDDLLISSSTFQLHLEHMKALNDRAAASGFEFKLAKGRFNQVEVELWGCICGRDGRRAVPKKIEHLENWPYPIDCHDVTSFVAFVNYLREFMDPDWVKHEQTLAPFSQERSGL